MSKFILAAALLAGCTNDDGALRALEGAGYTNIQLHGYSLACPDSDHSCTEFTALGPTGHLASGAVGCGLLVKGCTIRTF